MITDFANCCCIFEIFVSMDISGTSVVPSRKNYDRVFPVYKGNIDRNRSIIIETNNKYLAFLTTATVCDSPPSSDFSFTRSMTPGEKHVCRSSACFPILKDSFKITFHSSKSDANKL